MQLPKDKAALLDTLRREHAYWEALLQLVPEDEMLTPGAMGEWTFKDVVAHLTAWRKRTIARLAGALQGGEPLPPEWPAGLGDEALSDEGKPDHVRPINDWIYRTQRDRPLADVLAESQEVWRQLAAVVQALPEADLLEPGRFGWMEGRALGPSLLNWSFAHLHEHAAMLNDWLARMLDEA